jgi:hypothetical protein
MPIHDWTRVDAGIFHHFHQDWITEIARRLNRGLLSPPYYALAEQIAAGRGPDVLTLQAPAADGEVPAVPSGTVAVATAPPRVHFHAKSELDVYATRANAVVIRHVSGHRPIAVLEISSPGNKSNRHGVRAFVDKAVEMLKGGIHLLVVDLLPPRPRDPNGLPKAIWDELSDNDFHLPPDKPLSVGAYIGGPLPETFIEPTAVGAPVPTMPLFLTPDDYIRAPLDEAYQTAWDSMPPFWRDVLSRG